MGDIAHYKFDLGLAQHGRGGDGERPMFSRLGRCSEKEKTKKGTRHKTKAESLLLPPRLANTLKAWRPEVPKNVLGPNFDHGHSSSDNDAPSSSAKLPRSRCFLARDCRQAAGWTNDHLFTQPGRGRKKYNVKLRLSAWPGKIDSPPSELLLLLLSSFNVALAFYPLK